MNRPKANPLVDRDIQRPERYTGTEGQDRKAYTDTQDRKTYTATPEWGRCSHCAGPLHVKVDGKPLCSCGAKMTMIKGQLWACERELEHWLKECKERKVEKKKKDHSVAQAIVNNMCRSILTK